MSERKKEGMNERKKRKTNKQTKTIQREIQKFAFFCRTHPKKKENLIGTPKIKESFWALTSTATLQLRYLEDFWPKNLAGNGCSDVVLYLQPLLQSSPPWQPEEEWAGSLLPELSSGWAR